MNNKLHLDRAFSDKQPKVGNWSDKGGKRGTKGGRDLAKARKSLRQQSRGCVWLDFLILWIVMCALVHGKHRIQPQMEWAQSERRFTGLFCKPIVSFPLASAFTKQSCFLRKDTWMKCFLCGCEQGRTETQSGALGGVVTEERGQRSWFLSLGNRARLRRRRSCCSNTDFASAGHSPHGTRSLWRPRCDFSSSGDGKRELRGPKA